MSLLKEHLARFFMVLYSWASHTAMPETSASTAVTLNPTAPLLSTASSPGLPDEEAETTGNPACSKQPWTWIFSFYLPLIPTSQRECLQPGDPLSGLILQGYSPAKAGVCGRLGSCQTLHVSQQPCVSWAKATVGRADGVYGLHTDTNTNALRILCHSQDRREWDRCCHWCKGQEEKHKFICSKILGGEEAN